MLRRMSGAGGAAASRLLRTGFSAAACFAIIAFAAAAQARPQSSTSHRELTFAERVEALRSISRVRHSHQIGGGQPFEHAVTDAWLEREVRTQLRRSAALARFWNVRLTADDLRREAARVARGSRMPERLAEMYAAVGNDPVVVQECLLRPRLEERLARSYFESDPRFRKAGGARGSWDDWWRDVEPDLDERSVSTIALTGPGALPAAASCVPDNVWDNGILGGPLPARRSGHTAVWTGSLVLVVGGSWDGPVGERYDPVLDDWSAMSESGGPGHRYGTSAVWTGSRLIVWGGSTTSNGTMLNDGRSYDPVLDRWFPVTSSGAPTPRFEHLASWSGTEMIVWGGYNSTSAWMATGGRYNPDTNSWRPTTTVGAPSPRRYASAVWAGAEMIIWGGELYAAYLATGARYDPVRDHWTPMSDLGAPQARSNHVAVSTGNTVIIWGGTLLGGAGTPLPTETGARYDLATDTWQAMDTRDAPPRMTEHTGVWTGTRLIVWGTGPGGSYDPSSDSWSLLSTAGAPAPRTGHAAVWTGSRMVVWGGTTTDVSQYDPAAGLWTQALGRLGPAPRASHTAVWSGSEMIVWGGLQDEYLPLGTGSRYDPALDSWTPLPAAGAPSPRHAHVAVWGGGSMLVWGGTDDEAWFQDGARYDPLADAWTPMARNRAPLERSGASVVWTGSEMIVWGGSVGGPVLDTGGRYDLAADRWSPLSRSGAPPARMNAGAVWTGTEMIVWGGTGTGGLLLGSGGRYDPASDAWSPVGASGAPEPRSGHSAVWTGAEMIVWGGGVSSGGRYDPATDSWLPVFPFGLYSTTTAVWTGAEMIIWGRGAGGRYRPDVNAWSAVSTVNAPAIWRWHTALWADNQMIVWGGQGITSNDLRSGGRYGADLSPDADLDGNHTGCNGDCDDSNPAIYPGAPQACGDGLNNDCLAPGWPALAGTNEGDDDGDSFNECGGDCDDTRAAVYPGAPQVCDALNNDCTDPSWPTPPPENVDSDGDGWTACTGDCTEGASDIHPGAPQLCDGVNNDCSDPAWPAIPDDEQDADRDGWARCEGDCDDTRATVTPGGFPVCDDLNNNCSSPGWPSTAGTEEADDDGDGLSECSGDCTDFDARAWGDPAEVGELTFSLGGGSLQWSAPPPAGGTFFCYDLYRTDTVDNLAGSGVCLELNDCNSVAVVADPPGGIIHYFLVRARTLCPAPDGKGPWGSASGGQPRVVNACQ